MSAGAPKGAGQDRDSTGPTIVSSFQRRPLGASIPPADRLVVFEQWIRDTQDAIDRLAGALYALDSGRHPNDDAPISADHAWRLLRIAAVDLQELRARPFRVPSPTLKRSRRR